jgi:putative membrane protein
MDNVSTPKAPNYWRSWLILALYVIVLFLSNYGFSALWILSFPLALIFAIMHGSRKYGWKGACLFILISVIVSLGYENLSIATGFPFGWYHWSHEKNPGPFIGNVPLLTAVAYCGTGYISWTLAQILVAKPGGDSGKSLMFITPALAAFIMVMWDMSMDPMASTVAGVWVWHHGGGFYGVPLSNFLGWWLVVYTIYQLFALFALSNRLPTRPVYNAAYWYQVIIFYFFIGVGNILPNQLHSKEVATDMAGKTWNVGDIYEGTLIVAIFTMGFVCLLAAARVFRMSAIEDLNTPI